MTSRTRTVVVVAFLVTVTLWLLRRRGTIGGGVDEGPWSASDSVPSLAIELPERRDGSRDDRGSEGAVQLDLARARQHHLEPVVEFLTYVQEQRGDRSHLLFVRYADLDALATHEHTPVEEFLSRLDQLGVVVSQN